MNGGELTLLGGFVFGLASALHCAAMCGGISSGALLLLRPNGSGERVVALLLMQLGRITVYTSFGSIAGAFGSQLFGSMDAGTATRVLQWAGAVSLMWIGISMAGFAPRLAVVDQGVLSFSRSLDRMAASLRSRQLFGPYALGLGWGVSACPMVYGALFTAALTGTAAGGAVWMLGFGLGTVPAVFAAAFGVTSLTRFAKRHGLQTIAGLTIAAFGFMTVYLPWPMSSVLCAMR